MIPKPTKKIKLCKCGKPRLKGSSLCYGCYRAKQRARKEELALRKKERKLNSKGYQEKSKKKLFKECWKLMSLWIRKKDADWKGNVKCFTCGQLKNYKETNAGHYIHDKLDFDERNLKVQCIYCNKYLSGNLGVYGEKLIDIFGLDWVKELRKDAIKKGNNYSYKELENIKSYLETKI